MIRARNGRDQRFCCTLGATPPGRPYHPMDVPAERSSMNIPEDAYRAIEDEIRSDVSSVGS